MSREPHQSNGHTEPDPLAALQQAALDADVEAAVRAWHADPDSHALSPHVRAAARAAFASSLRTVRTPVAAPTLPPTVAATPPAGTLRVVSGASSVGTRRGPWLRAAAAVLLVGLASFALWGGGSQPLEAAAGVRVTSVQRIDEAATVRALPSVERGRVATVGEVFAPRPDELLALELDGAAWIVLRSGDAVQVSDERCGWSETVCFSPEMRARVRRVFGKAGDALASRDALLRIDRGELRVASRGAPVPVWVAGRGLVVVTHGAAHLMAPGPAQATDPIVSLAAASRAVLFPLAGEPVGLDREGSVTFGPRGAERAGPAAASLFRELAFFGDFVPRSSRTIDVPARRWTVDAGVARLRADGLRFEARGPLQVRWRVPPGLEAARTLRVSLRGPAGLTVRVPALGLERQIEAASSQDEPGVRVVELELPPRWIDQLQGLPLVLHVSAPDATAQAVGWFDAAAFVVPADTLSGGAGSERRQP